jgi:hypothetical protein
MNTVRDGNGTRYLLLERSASSSRVRDPQTGTEQSLPNDEIEFVEESALSTAARAAPTALRRELGTLRDERTLGLLREIGVREPVGAVALLDAYDLCESDLHGMLGELRAAGLVEPADLDDPLRIRDRGYRTTERTHDASEPDRGERDGPDVDG